MASGQDNSDSHERTFGDESLPSEELLAFLTEKGLDNMTCELCGEKEWVITTAGGNLVDAVVNTVVGESAENCVGKVKKAFFYLFCVDCGNSKQFNAALIRAKLRPTTPENKYFLDLLSAAQAAKAAEKSNV